MTIRQPSRLAQRTWGLTPRPWLVTTTAGSIRTTHQVEAVTMAAAIQGALELAGTGAQLVACLRDGEWS